MKKRVFSLILAVILLSVFVPLIAFAEVSDLDEYSLYVGGVGMKKGDYLPVGATETQINMPESQGYAFYNGVDLILDNYSFTGEGYLCKVKYDKYTTKVYPTVIYSKTTLSLVINGDCSLVGKHDSYTTRSIYSDGDVKIKGKGKLYLKSKRPIYAIENVSVSGIFLDIYSEYFYGIYSEKASILTNDASVRIRGSLGMQTFTNNENMVFTGSHLDISVTDMGLFSSGDIVIDDSYVKIVSYNPEFPNSYSAIYTSGGDIIYTSVEGKGSFNASGNNSVTFDKEESAGYHWVEFSRINKLSYIDVADILLPESMAYPDFNGKADSPYTEILDIEWFRLENDVEAYRMDIDDFFSEGEKYRLKVTVKAGNSYEFDDIETSAYIGNDLVNNYCFGLNNKIRVLEKDYVATNNPGNYSVNIGNVTLKDGDYLAKGASSVTDIKPEDNYAYYYDGALYLYNFVDRNAEIEFQESVFEIYFEGENTIDSIRDISEKDGSIHHVIIFGEGSLDIIGSNSYSSSPCGVNLNGALAIIGGDVYIDADITYCLDVEAILMFEGNLYCYSSQAGVFARGTSVSVIGGVFHAFDGGGWSKFINEDVVISGGTVYVSGDGKNSLETATEWDMKTPLTDYYAVWVLPKSNEDEPDLSEPDISETEPDYVLGDVTGDGVITSTDYLRIKAHFLGSFTLEGIALKAGDVTGDGTITSTDYLRIKAHFLGTFDLHG